MSEKLWSEKLIENAATSNVILSRQEWDSLIEGIRSLEAELESARNARSDGVDKAVRAIETVGNLKRLQAENAELRETITNAGALALQRDNEIKDLREKLAAMTANREEWKEESKRNAAQAAKANEAWAKLNETVQEQSKKLAEAENDLDSCKSTCDQLRDSNNELLAELARLKSERIDRVVAPEDGPWVLCQGTGDNIKIFRRPSDQEVAVYGTLKDAYEACNLTRHRPVRLSDVTNYQPARAERGGGMVLDEKHNILDWAKNTIEGAGGLEDFERYECAVSSESDRVTAAYWVIKCLANPDCEGSAEVLAAIMERRANHESTSEGE